MQKLSLTWENGKGYTLTIDDIAFERSVTAFTLECNAKNSPILHLEMFGNMPLQIKSEKTE